MNPTNHFLNLKIKCKKYLLKKTKKVLISALIIKLEEKFLKTALNIKTTWINKIYKFFLLKFLEF